MPFEEWFWELKRGFPGDSDFSLENYADLPYNFVIKSIKALQAIKRKELFNYEIPIANIAAMQANFKRDPKKNKKAYTYKDFCFFSSREDSDAPAVRYGSAAVQLAIQGRFPHWGLFVFSDLKKASNPNVIPEMLALVAEDAMLLAPIKTEYGWLGFLIAMESASDSVRTFVDDNGNEYSLSVPVIETKIVAREDTYLN